MQIVDKRAGVRRIVAHLGSAHDAVELAVLMQAARQRLNEGQDELDLGLDAPAQASPARARVVATASQVLWDVLSDAYRLLGFDAVDDEALRLGLVSAVVEPSELAAATAAVVASITQAPRAVLMGTKRKALARAGVDPASPTLDL